MAGSQQLCKIWKQHPDELGQLFGAALCALRVAGGWDSAAPIKRFSFQRYSLPAGRSESKLSFLPQQRSSLP